MKNKILQFLSLPDYTEGYDLDDPRITEMRRDIIMRKPFLRKLYEEWYGDFKKKLKSVPPGKFVEIGSGAGFIKEVIPEVITSDIMPLSYSDLTFMAEDMPFADGELSAILMVDVLHHIPESASFFKEAQRTLKKGGKILMTEPANSPWGHFIYTRFHHEPFEPEAKEWKIPSTGPLSGANGALPWIIFERDRKRFETEFPNLKIREVKYHTPLRYLLSGGVSLKSLVPGFSFGVLSLFEKLFGGKTFSMFMSVEVEKV